MLTRGSTLLGAAWRLAEAFPTLRVRAFAVIRTQGLQAEIDRIVEPVCETIRMEGDRAERDP